MEEKYIETATGRMQKVNITPEKVGLGDMIVVDGSWYGITAIYKYNDAEYPENYWFDFTGTNEMGEKVYIGADKNQEYIWEYMKWDILSKKDVRNNPDLKDINYNEHSLKISHDGIEYELYNEDNMLYEANVLSWVQGREENPIAYPVWISDLEDEDGEKFLSIEVDEDNVVEISLGEYSSDVELIKKENDEKKVKKSFFSRLFGK